VIVAVVVLVGVFAFVNHNSSSNKSASGSAASGSTGTGGLSYEGIPLQLGPPLAGLEKAATGQTVNGIQCSAQEQVDYHIHSHLSIYQDGVLRPVALGIGIVKPQLQDTGHGQAAGASKCYYWLHTHTNDGVIHVESPTTKVYTLADFFAIWGQPLSAGQVGPAKGTVTAYVNGKVFSGNPATIPLSSHSTIQLNVGKNQPPPGSIDWSKSQL